MMMFKKLGLFLVFTLILGVGTSLAQDEVDVVRIGTLPNLGSSPYYVGIAEGYFAAQNIALEIVELPQAANAETITMLLQGDLDVVQTFLNPGIINLVNRGEPVTLVSSTGQYIADECANWSFVVPEGQAEDFDYTSLVGATVAVTNGAPIYHLDLFLQTHGLTLEDVTIENVPPPARAEAVVNGAVAFAWIPEPNLTMALQNQGVEALASSGEVVPGMDAGMIFYGATMTEREDDLGIRFMTAYLQANTQLSAGATERNVEIVAEALTLEPELIAELCWSNRSLDGAVNLETTSAYMEWLLAQMQIDSVADLEALYDPSYAEAAVEILPDVLAAQESGS